MIEYHNISQTVSKYFLLQFVLYLQFMYIYETKNKMLITKKQLAQLLR